MVFVFVLIGIAFIIAIYLFTAYNGLISMKNRIQESFAAIDVYLTQRFDTLTKTAEVVVGYAKHEKETFTKVTELRKGITSATSDEQKIATYNQMEKMLGGINVQVENYPELKANENYLQLQRTINDLEEKLSASRRTYNANVARFNTMIEVIPTNIFARRMGFTQKGMLETEERKRADVDMGSLLKG
jgi:LemA protein